MPIKAGSRSCRYDYFIRNYNRRETAMHRIAKLTNGLRRNLAIGVLLVPAFCGTALAQVEPQADELIKSMSKYLAGLPAFEAQYDVDTDYLLQTGEKLQFSASGTIAVNRPDGLHADRRGGFADLDMYFDGSAVTVFGHVRNAYAKVDAKGTIDDALKALRSATGNDFPGGDLLSTDSYRALMNDVESGAYWGTTYVNGIECHYAAFRAKDVDWQIWIQTGAQPLPLKLVITSKWMAGSPQFSLRLRNWNVSSKPDVASFRFTPPAGAKNLGELTPDMIGDPQVRK